MPAGGVDVPGMGDRVVRLLAEEMFWAGRIAALLCMGRPFHPSYKLDQLRTVHLDPRVQTRRDQMMSPAMFRISEPF